MDHDVWQYFIDIGYKVLLLFVVFIAVVTFCFGIACGQEVDGICQITHETDNGSTRWCGVAISDKEVLTCAHHRVTGSVRIEFCAEKHGSPYRISVPGRIVRSDVKRDLSLIRYEIAPWMRMRSYVVGWPKGQAAIKGFLGSSCEVREGLPGRKGLEVEFFPVVEIRTTCQQGLSGSPLVHDYTVGGILIGSGGGVSHCVSPETILDWLEE